MAWGQRAGKALPAGSTPQPGDLIVWDEHIGIVESVGADGSIHTIEGNSSDSVSQRDLRLRRRRRRRLRPARLSHTIARVSGLQTEAGTILVLAPDWRRPLDWLPALAAYVVAAPLDGDTCLALDARGGELPVNSIAKLLERACEYVSEGRDFPEVLLVVDDVDLGDDPVTGAGDLVERLGLRVSAAGRGPATTIVSMRAGSRRSSTSSRTEVDRACSAAARPVRARRRTAGDGPHPHLRLGRPAARARDPVGPRRQLSQRRAARLQRRAAAARPRRSRGTPDPRIRYLEVEERPRYPSRASSFWQVAGTSAVNRLVEEARGDVIAPLDHDDAFTHDHIPVLLDALRAGADFAFGRRDDGDGAPAPGACWAASRSRHGRIVHASVMYTRRLAHMRYDPEAWLLNEPGDWNLWHRIRDAGAKIGHVAHPIVVHFKEGSSKAGLEDDPDRLLEHFAEDVRGTPAVALLEVAAHGRGAQLG